MGKSVEGFPKGQVASGLEAKIPRENIFCWGFLFFGFQIKVLEICINRLSQRLALMRGVFYQDLWLASAGKVYHHILGLQSLVALHDHELDTLAFDQNAVAVAANGPKVHEDIIA